jgi:hypothetical protein
MKITAERDPAHTWLRKVVQTTAKDVYRDLGATVIE